MDFNCIDEYRISTVLVCPSCRVNKQVSYFLRKERERESNRAAEMIFLLHSMEDETVLKLMYVMWRRNVKRRFRNSSSSPLKSNKNILCVSAQGNYISFILS